MQNLWTCPNCNRRFRQVNQRHSCGVGDRKALLGQRPPSLVRLYDELERQVLTFGAVEIVYRDKYALFRTSRIFADLVVMKEALRLAVHLKREVDEDLFFKMVRGERGKISYVAKIRTEEELMRMLPYLNEAYRISLQE